MSAKQINNWTGIGLPIREGWHANRLNLNKRPILDVHGGIIPDIDPNILKKCSGDILVPGEFIVDGRVSPPSSITREHLKTYYELYCNILVRIWHLAETMHTISEAYHTNRALYSDRILAFIGNEVVREWPWKDFQFTSVAAQEIISKATPYTLTGLYNFEIVGDPIIDKLSELHYEHWAPISFFRDIFTINEGLSTQDFFEILVCNYRVVRITKVEDRRLSSMKFKQQRPREAYNQAGIEIYEKRMWNGTF